MLSRLSSYIFGGLFGAPDAETTPLRYETREAAGDWLLVDMPDQAIDDEDMDSDSEEDDILAAVPMLMTENDLTEQPGRVVLTYEEARDSSICDNYNNIQNSCYVDIQDNSDTKILNISDIQGESDYDMYNLNEFPWLFTDDRFQNSLVEIQDDSNEKLGRNFDDKCLNNSADEMSNDDMLDSEKIETSFLELEREFREDDMAIIKELTSILSDNKVEPQVFEDDETLESSINSDNQVQENSDDFRYSSDDEFQDNSDSEENRMDSDDEIPEDRIPKYLELALISRRRKLPISEVCRRTRCAQLLKNRRNATNMGPMKMLSSPYCARFHEVCCVKNPLYEHAANFQILPNTWDTNQTLHYPSKFSLAVAQCYSGTLEFGSSTLGPLIAVLQAQIQRREFSAFKPSSTLTDRNDHPEYLKRVYKLRDTALKMREAKTTALALGQVKEIKPIQEAIQYESKKYLTRSHLNRQNKNYLYQSSVKTNRRRNLQRNHSGANNNRRC
jgi:hypothetical protein